MILKKPFFCVLTLITLFFLSGCTFKYGDGLLEAPRLPEAYSQLQTKLDEIAGMGQTLQVSAESGNYRQPVQLRDLDMDGVDEAIAFFRTAESDINIYFFSQVKGEYEVIDVVEVPGSLRAVRYPRINEKGEQAVAVSWGQEGNYGMTVITLSPSGQLEIILEARYSQVTLYDLNGDGADELFFVRRVMSDTEEPRYTLSIYGIKEGVYKELSVAPLCKEVKSVSNFSFEKDDRGGVTIYVDSQGQSTGNYVTDVVFFDGRQAYNLSMDAASGEGKFSRWQSVFSADINGDGKIDIPTSNKNASIGETPAARDTRQSMLYWINFAIDGEFSVVFKTYHNVADKWFIFWPDAWGNDVYARTEKSAYIQYVRFYTVTTARNDDDHTDDERPLLHIYTFSGDDRDSALFYDNVKMFRLTTSGNSYGFRIPLGGDEKYALAENQIENIFRVIDTGW